jgi:hypothetical protein
MTPDDASGGAWAVSLDPPVLLPSRDAHVSIEFTPDRDVQARGVRAALIGTETYRYRRQETQFGADGKTHMETVEHTDHHEVGRLETTLAGPGLLAHGQPNRWNWQIHVPDLGPATFEGDVLRCEWQLSASVDISMRPDAGFQMPVHVPQPTALLRAGVLDTGEYGLFDEAPANVDAHPAQIRLAPVPICITEAFSGAVTIETAEPVPVQEVRLELRVQAQVTVSGGLEEEITISHGHLQTDGRQFGGPLATHPFTADAPMAWLPSVDLPHGRARATFHLILAQSWAPDIHYVRDVALCSTTTL